MLSETLTTIQNKEIDTSLLLLFLAISSGAFVSLNYKNKYEKVENLENNLIRFQVIVFTTYCLNN